MVTGVSTLDDVRPRSLAAIAATDPDAEQVAPPAPWHGIIREQLDGAAVPGLVLTREGFPGNDFFQPFVAAEGTLT